MQNVREKDIRLTIGKEKQGNTRGVSDVEILHRAHNMARTDEKKMRNALEKLLKVYPGLQEEMRRNLETYGTPTLAGGIGGCRVAAPNQIHPV